MKLKYIWLVAGLVGLLGARLPVAAQVFTIQHNFTNTPDGATPGQLTWTNGYLYGVTANGGTNGDGMIYRVNPNGTGFTPVYSFTGAANNGISPNDLLVTSNMIYGTTLLGGTNSLGMIFAVSTNGTGFQPLYSFGAQPDGQFPQAGLVLGGSALYGTAHTGGTNSGGVLFKINLDGTGYTILHWFTNSPDGYSPQSDLVLSGSTLFGTTAFGGTNNGGIVFSIGTNGTGYTILHSFTNSPDGEWVYGGLVLNSGILYGNTDSGGTNSAGTIFAINTNGSGYKILYDFSAIAGNTDGWQPKGTLTCSGGTLYGTTTVGGSGGQGTVFQISTNGTGFAVVKSFTNSPADGSEPVSGVLPVGTGVWGTTYAGGSGGLGILYSLQLTPVIIAPPQSLTVTNGTPATFTVTAKDDTVTNYQWYFNTNTLLAGQTGSTLTFASATNNNAGTYTVVVSDNLGSVTSSPAVLTVVTKPVITAQPQNVTATNGNPASFSVGAALGGCISLVVNGTWMLVVASAVCALTTAYTYFHADRRSLFD